MLDAVEKTIVGRTDDQRTQTATTHLPTPNRRGHPLLARLVYIRGPWRDGRVQRRAEIQSTHAGREVRHAATNPLPLGQSSTRMHPCPPSQAQASDGRLPFPEGRRQDGQLFGIILRLPVQDIIQQPHRVPSTVPPSVEEHPRTRVQSAIPPDAAPEAATLHLRRSNRRHTGKTRGVPAPAT